MPSRFAAASMMRMFAWCGMNSSTSSTATPARRTASRAASGITRTANLNTSLPSMWMNVASGSLHRSTAGSSEPHAGTDSFGPPLPSAPRYVERTPPSSTGPSTHAPRAVAEQDAGAAVGKVRHVAQEVCADHQHPAVGARFDAPGRHVEAVDEA